jgi:hypothetical protein
MSLTQGTILGSATSRQAESLQRNLFWHYTFKYMLMRTLLPLSAQGFYVWLSW